jgi:Tfp pilus assembly major pilin PilA
MTVRLRSKQQGITFLGLLFVGGVLAVSGVIAAQVVPTAIEYQAVMKAANRAREGTSVAEVRAAFDRSAAVDDIKSISGKDIEVTKEGDKVVVAFSYQREIHLVGPAWLTLKYAGRTK